MVLALCSHYFRKIQNGVFRLSFVLVNLCSRKLRYEKKEQRFNQIKSLNFTAVTQIIIMSWQSLTIIICMRDFDKPRHQSCKCLCGWLPSPPDVVQLAQNQRGAIGVPPYPAPEFSHYVLLLTWYI